MSEAKTNRHILDVQAPVEWDFTRFVEDVSWKRPVSFVGCEVQPVSNPASHFRPEFEAELLRIGLSAFLQRQLLMEDVVPRGEHEDRILSTFLRFLHAAGVDDELIVVDPYFFPTKRSPGYAAFVGSLLSPFATQLRRLIVITGRQSNADAKTEVAMELGRVCPHLSIDHKCSDDFHDRWWITKKRSAGLFVGASLNGLGRKYALIDRLSSEDVRDIVASLAREGLVP